MTRQRQVDEELAAKECNDSAALPVVRWNPKQSHRLIYICRGSARRVYRELLVILSVTNVVHQTRKFAAYMTEEKEKAAKESKKQLTMAQARKNNCRD
jgi:hypothetical protein